jgi:hemerythrin superfamily protein
MDAIKVLTADHDLVRELFSKFRAAKESDDHDTMRKLQHEIFHELETHTRIEEDIFYPAVKNLSDDLSESVDESLQEHHVVKVLMREIEPLSDPDVFVAKMTVLIENVEHHADEEESDMFPEIRDRLSSEQLDELGAELEAAKS